MVRCRCYFKLTMIMLGSLLLLSGCKSTPESALNLEFDVEQQRSLPPVQLSVVDHRPQNHVVRLHRGNQPAEFATTERPLASLMSAALRQAITTSNESIQTLTVTVDKALCTVEQSLSSHRAICEVVIIAASEDPRGVLTKTFSRRRTREGSLQVDFKDLENDLSALFSSTLNSSLQDSGMRQWLNSYENSELATSN
ncbi:YajG family lipoprotein [Aliidiomarina sp. B3213]|nr:YajG family lipoprotein [Aliidiomarina sp. B3213]RTE86007.1 hypothetical protein DQX04_05385 [Aliidiomarina sp. B3213]